MNKYCFFKKEILLNYISLRTTKYHTIIINWVCNGTITNGDILRTYQKIVDPNFTFNEKVLNEQESWDAGNAAGLVIPERMIEIFGEDKVPKINDAVDHLIHLIKLEKDKQQQQQ